MKTLPSIQPNQEIQEKKKQAWANMGEKAYLAELQLQAIAQDALKDLPEPKSIEEVPAAEAKLTEIKKAQKFVESKRKEVTGPLDDFAKRIMQNEKSFDDPIKRLSAAIISVKKQHEELQRIFKAKEEEAKSIRHAASLWVSDAQAAFLTKIENQINLAFNYALGNGNVSPEGIAEYLEKCLAKFNEDSFSLPKQTIIGRNHSPEEVQAIANPVYSTHSPADYLTKYREGLRFKFSDYEVAHSNKQDALLKAQEEEKAKLAKIEEERKNKEIAANMDAMATPVQQAVYTGPSTRELKKSYEIDMPETVESVLIIMAAFAANIHLCMPKLKVNKWFAFTPAQAGNALAKVKCDDNNFAPSGIIFKEVDKL